MKTLLFLDISSGRCRSLSKLQECWRHGRQGPHQGSYKRDRLLCAARCESNVCSFRRVC